MNHTPSKLQYYWGQLGVKAFSNFVAWVNRFSGIPIVVGDENLPITSKQVVHRLVEDYMKLSPVVPTLLHRSRLH